MTPHAPYAHPPTPVAARLTDPAAIRRFLLAGRAVVTLRNVKSGNHLTFRVVRDERAHVPVWLVSTLVGPDNGRDYALLARLLAPRKHFLPPPQGSREFAAGLNLVPASDDGGSAPASRAPLADRLRVFYAVWRHVVQDRPPPGVEVWHEGRCGRCGRTLTVPESIASGLGPECATRGRSGE